MFYFSLCLYNMYWIYVVIFSILIMVGNGTYVSDWSLYGDCIKRPPVICDLFVSVP